ncbi:hippocampus abundant transcript 1 protein-like isoform X1 [Notamacropus eugenii]|uniref:hippocampus abundant transcript 1 protein-like isoform X1 n=1 Tax=Notamacropus eugenii TaxID=9315 RepID=UPI003B672EC8
MRGVYDRRRGKEGWGGGEKNLCPAVFWEDSSHLKPPGDPAISSSHPSINICRARHDGNCSLFLVSLTPHPHHISAPPPVAEQSTPGIGMVEGGIEAGAQAAGSCRRSGGGVDAHAAAAGGSGSLRRRRSRPPARPPRELRRRCLRLCRLRRLSPPLTGPAASGRGASERAGGARAGPGAGRGPPRAPGLQDEGAEPEPGAPGPGGGTMTGEKKKKKRLNRSVLLAKKIITKDGGARQGIGEPSVYHAVVVIFLEFFAWGLLTTPMLTVLHQTFPQHTFLMNGLIHGVKGLLSFLSAPLIGALSDVWGRKSFLLLTVFFTCAPIPLMKISPWWYFAVISMSGVFAVTFSVIFAYVADITQEHERSTAYGLVSATFAASLVTSPAIGAYLSRAYGDTLVVVLASGVALLDIGFILLAVPESLPEEMRPASWGAPISWEQADPFASLRKVGQDSTVLLICITVFLSYLPEAGQYSSFFLYLRQVISFSSETVAAFIGVVGILSILAQTVVLGILMRSIGNKNTILLGLGFQILQLAWYGFGSQPWMMWAAGAVAAMSSITFPAISAMVSRNADPDQQGVVQGMITGIRGLCNGLGPALYGFVFYLFHVELNEMVAVESLEKATKPNMANPSDERSIIPGPPFLFGACSVLLSLLVALFIPEHNHLTLRSGSHKKHSNGAQSHTHSPQAGGLDGKEPLLVDSSV